jgi:hypothetical protein
MIEGFKFEVTSVEAAQKIDALIAHHQQRLKLIEAEIASVTRRPLEDFKRQIDEHFEEHHGEREFEGGPRPNPSKVRNNVLNTLRLAAESRRSMIERLSFARPRLVQNESFRVDWVELGHLFRDSRDHGGLATCFGHVHDEDEEDGLTYFGPTRRLADDEETEES